MFKKHVGMPGWLCQVLKQLIPSDMADLKVTSNDFHHLENIIPYPEVGTLTSGIG